MYMHVYMPRCCKSRPSSSSLSASLTRPLDPPPLVLGGWGRGGALKRDIRGTSPSLALVRPSPRPAVTRAVTHLCPVARIGLTILPLPRPSSVSYRRGDVAIKCSVSSSEQHTITQQGLSSFALSQRPVQPSATRVVSHHDFWLSF